MALFGRAAPGDRGTRLARCHLFIAACQARRERDIAGQCMLRKRAEAARGIDAYVSRKAETQNGEKAEDATADLESSRSGLPFFSSKNDTPSLYSSKHGCWKTLVQGQQYQRVPNVRSRRRRRRSWLHALRPHPQRIGFATRQLCLAVQRRCRPVLGASAGAYQDLLAQHSIWHDDDDAGNSHMTRLRRTADVRLHQVLPNV